MIHRKIFFLIFVLFVCASVKAEQSKNSAIYVSHYTKKHNLDTFTLKTDKHYVKKVTKVKASKATKKSAEIVEKNKEKNKKFNEVKKLYGEKIANECNFICSLVIIGLIMYLSNFITIKLLKT